MPAAFSVVAAHAIHAAMQLRKPNAVPAMERLWSFSMLPARYTKQTRSWTWSPVRLLKSNHAAPSDPNVITAWRHFESPSALPFGAASRRRSKNVVSQDNPVLIRTPAFLRSSASITIVSRSLYLDVKCAQRGPSKGLALALRTIACASAKLSLSQDALLFRNPVPSSEITITSGRSKHGNSTSEQPVSSD